MCRLLDTAELMNLPADGCGTAGDLDAVVHPGIGLLEIKVLLRKPLEACAGSHLHADMLGGAAAVGLVPARRAGCGE